MSTSPAERRWEGSAAALVLIVLTTVLSSCGMPWESEDPVPEVTSAVVPARDEVVALMDRRAAAVRDGNLTAFLADIDRADPAFVLRQERYFLNLRELPLDTFEYDVPDGRSASLTDGRLRSVVNLRIKIRNYDAIPVETPGMYTFTRSPDGVWMLSNDVDAEFEAANDIEAQPWDLTRIEVESGNGVLGIFDDRSVNTAYQVIRAVEKGLADIDAEVPLPWDRRVVVYALSDIDVLADLDDLPGGDPERLDGVAFPVLAGPHSHELASTRFMLHPRMLGRNGPVRDRLIRHELTHVALGERDDRVPTWLSEGIAEYVSVQAVPREDRLIASEALQAARAGVDALPPDLTFNGEHSGANYGIAWFACEFIVAQFGEPALWRLFDAMREGNGTSERDQDAVLRAVLGVDSTEVARGAARKIVKTFG